MHPFAYSRADDPAKAIAAHAHDPLLAFIAGGTDLLGLIKDRATLPERLLDINGLPDMARIDVLPDGGLRIGALARMSDVAVDAEVRRRFPVIAEALLFAASGQLRNMASIGGNIMQRTRCAYFRDLATAHTAARRVTGSLARFTFERLIGHDPAFTELIASAQNGTHPGGLKEAARAFIVAAGVQDDVQAAAPTPLAVFQKPSPGNSSWPFSVKRTRSSRATGRARSNVRCCAAWPRSSAAEEPRARPGRQGRQGHQPQQGHRLRHGLSRRADTRPHPGPLGDRCRGAQPAAPARDPGRRACDARGPPDPPQPVDLVRGEADADAPPGVLAPGGDGPRAQRREAPTGP